MVKLTKQEVLSLKVGDEVTIFHAVLGPLEAKLDGMDDGTPYDDHWMSLRENPDPCSGDGSMLLDMKSLNDDGEFIGWTDGVREWLER